MESPANAFPSVNPRPVTPDHTLRYFKAKGAPPATHVKFVVVANQCTGQPSYAGDQDQDPNNNADCLATDARERGARERTAGLQQEGEGGGRAAGRVTAGGENATVEGRPQAGPPAFWRSILDEQVKRRA